MAHFLVFLGSARDSTPPAPVRLGLRVPGPAQRAGVGVMALSIYDYPYIMSSTTA